MNTNAPTDIWVGEGICTPQATCGIYTPMTTYAGRLLSYTPPALEQDLHPTQGSPLAQGHYSTNDSQPLFAFKDRSVFDRIYTSAGTFSPNDTMHT